MRLAALFLAAVPFAASAQDMDSVDKAYMAALFAEPGRVQAEFDVLFEKNPLLTTYFAALVAQRRCQMPAPTKALYEAGGGEEALKTRDGRRTFMVSAAVTSLRFDTPEEQTKFCERTRVLLERAEAIVAAQ